MSGGAILVCGTASDAGKSVVVAGLCRWLARRGMRVAPFKAQNMALNSAVCADGAEVGRAQAAQARAAGVEVEAAMNPVLLKPSGERVSQVVVMGRAEHEVDARSYGPLRPRLKPVVLDALADLRSRFDAVVCEGAGSPAELNLREHDLVNMGLAQDAQLPVLVVGDIDRGGVLASLYGTTAVLDPADQALIAGFLVNKFRGDPSILAPGLDRLTELTGRPVLGVLPWRRGLWLDVEDSLALEAPREQGRPPVGRDALDVCVVRLRWMSNFTDVDALACEPGVTVRFSRSPADVERADLVIVPGTKATVEDLGRLRADGLDRALAQRARAGAPILGVCGGYQLLGTSIHDDVESRAGTVQGLGLLPVETAFAPDKVVRRRDGSAPGFGGVDASGYEVRHGRVASQRAWLRDATGEEDGCRAGNVLGTSWHGLLEGDEVRRALLSWVAAERGREWLPGDESFADVRERRLDVLGDLIEEHCDTDALLSLIRDGAPAGLPTLAAGAIA